MSDTTKETKPQAEDLMGYETAKAPETTLPETSTAKDTQTIINEAVKEVTVDDNGKYVYPENMDPVLKAAVAATKSYRDNQSGFTKSQQSLKETEAENIALKEQLANATQKPLELSTEDQTELDNLYTTDREAWRAKTNMLEQQSKEASEKAISEATDEARTKAGGEFELARRYEYLEEFNQGRKIPITVELMDTDIPPRITKKLADGEITFEGYLDEVAEYIDADKVVSKTADTTTTDLNKANGGTSPSDADKEKQGELDYSQQSF